MTKLILIMTTFLMILIAIPAQSTPLSFKVYNADVNSFHVNSTLVYGETEAAVIDTGFTRADALRIAANVLDSNKELTTIFISQADPDYYFGAETLSKIFPKAKILTSAAVHKAIQQKMAQKLAFWGPKMGENSPVTPVLPQVLTQPVFTVDGHKIEIKGSKGSLAHRPYLWIPSQKAILGNVAIFANLHVWTADVQDQNQWNAWLAQLKEMRSLSPTIVIPGHMLSGTQLSADSINYTIEYLTRFTQEKNNTESSEKLIATMKAAYPNALLPMALEIGAKVHMGEMQW